MKKRSPGRGRHYHLLRKLNETILSHLFFRNWPAHLWNLVPGAAEVSIIRRSHALPSGGDASCRMVFLSDLHIGPTTPEPLLENVFSHIRALQPDILLLGGDYVFLEAKASSLAMLSRLVASIVSSAKYAVLGNHDLWTHDGRIVDALQTAGTTVLVNQSRTLPPPWKNFTVAGLDDTYAGNCDGKAAFSKFSDSPATIVLCHSPDGLLHIGNHRFTYFLCGHTHGGQIATPWAPIITPVGRLSRRFSAGFFHVDSGEVFVSRGIGGVEVPVRWHAPADILCLDFVKKSV